MEQQLGTSSLRQQCFSQKNQNNLIYIHPVNRKNGQLRLKNIAPTTLYFSDRPDRIVGRVTTQKYVDYWALGDNSFKSDPPNAVISVLLGEEAEDINSYWIDGFFKETSVGDMESGNSAIFTLMSYSDTPLNGYVESLGWGISQQDGSTGFELLPEVSPTFKWIRLAQRVPVRVHLTEVPEHIKLRVGTTCSVLIKTGTSQ